MNTLRYIRLGAGYLEGYGHHPGTPFVVMMTLATGLAGLEGGLIGFLLASFLGLALYGSMWLVGAYGRGKDWTARQKRLTSKRESDIVIS